MNYETNGERRRNGLSWIDDIVELGEKIHFTKTYLVCVLYHTMLGSTLSATMSIFHPTWSSCYDNFTETGYTVNDCVSLVLSMASFISAWSVLFMKKQKEKLSYFPFVLSVVLGSFCAFSTFLYFVFGTRFCNIWSLVVDEHVKRNFRLLYAGKALTCYRKFEKVELTFMYFSIMLSGSYTFLHIQLHNSLWRPVTTDDHPPLHKRPAINQSDFFNRFVVYPPGYVPVGGLLSAPPPSPAADNDTQRSTAPASDSAVAGDQPSKNKRSDVTVINQHEHSERVHLLASETGRLTTATVRSDRVTRVPAAPAASAASVPAAALGDDKIRRSSSNDDYVDRPPPPPAYQPPNFKPGPRVMDSILQQLIYDANLWPRTVAVAADSQPQRSPSSSSCEETLRPNAVPSYSRRPNQSDSCSSSETSGSVAAKCGATSRPYEASSKRHTVDDADNHVLTGFLADDDDDNDNDDNDNDDNDEPTGAKKMSLPAMTAEKFLAVRWRRGRSSDDVDGEVEIYTVTERRRRHRRRRIATHNRGDEIDDDDDDDDSPDVDDARRGTPVTADHSGDHFDDGDEYLEELLDRLLHSDDDVRSPESPTTTPLSDTWDGRSLTESATEEEATIWDGERGQRSSSGRKGSDSSDAGSLLNRLFTVKKID